MEPQTVPGIGNLLLAHLPRHVFDAIAQNLTRVPAKHGEIIFERDEPITRILFPVHSVVSVVLEMSNGSIAEVGLIGRDGMTGISSILDSEIAQQRGVIQIADHADCLSIADFRAALVTFPEFAAAARRYVHASLLTSMYMSACNTLHSINQRCARWLLMAHDRVEGDSYYLTHEFLSQMLGVRRPSVTLAASALQAAGVIIYTRGRITIKNRTELEAVSCECYWSLCRSTVQILGYSVSKSSKARDSN